MVADTLAIRNGQAIRTGNRYEINRRVYEMEPTGRLFPVSGDGLVQLDRNEFKALMLLIKHGGRTFEVEEQLQRNPALPVRAVARAMELFRRRNGD